MKRLLPMVMCASIALLTGCGGSAGGGDSAAVAPYVATNAANAAASTSAASNVSNAGGSSPTCPTAADVKSALGFEVRELTKGMKRYGPISSCGYAATDEDSLTGVTVKFLIEPASEADARFNWMRNSVKVARGQQAEPDPIALGERGMAYRTLSMAMAAALDKGKVYSVELQYGGASKFGDKQAGTVTLLRQLMGA